MRIEIKLYSYHDLDLVSLYKTGRIAFPETTRQDSERLEFMKSILDKAREYEAVNGRKIPFLHFSPIRPENTTS